MTSIAFWLQHISWAVQLEASEGVNLGDSNLIWWWYLRYQSFCVIPPSSLNSTLLSMKLWSRIIKFSSCHDKKVRPSRARAGMAHNMKQTPFISFLYVYKEKGSKFAQKPHSRRNKNTVVNKCGRKVGNFNVPSTPKHTSWFHSLSATCHITNQKSTTNNNKLKKKSQLETKRIVGWVPTSANERRERWGVKERPARI